LSTQHNVYFNTTWSNLIHHHNKALPIIIIISHLLRKINNHK